MRQRLLYSIVYFLIVTKINEVTCLPTCDDFEVDVVIIGGGMSGIAAAVEIEKFSNLTYVVLEGQMRLGGRIHSQTFGNNSHVVELGANWIVGTKRNPIWKLAKSISLNTAFQNWNSLVVYRDGNKIKGNDMNWDVFEEARKCLDDNAILRDLGLVSGHDLSAREMLEICGWTPNDDLDDLIEYMTLDYEHAVSLEKLSIDGGFPEYAREHFDNKDRLVIDKRGFASIVESMASLLSSKPLLNKEVVLIDYNGQGAQVFTEMLDEKGNHIPCHVITSKKVISTLSVGVLNNKHSIFSPPFPEKKLNDMNAVYQMALFHKAFFVFPKKFWDDKEMISFAMKEKGKCQVWQNLDTSKFLQGSNILFCTVTEWWASKFEQFNDNEVQQELLKPLKLAYPDMPEPTDFIYSRWATNQWAFGSYEARIVNGTTDQFESFVAPLKNELESNIVYISGSASCKYHYGYVHGAYWAGKRSAWQVLRDFDVTHEDEDISSCDKERVTFQGEQFIV